MAGMGDTGDAGDDGTTGNTPDGIETGTFQLSLPRPLIEAILASAARQTPALSRNQEIERLLSQALNWSRAAYLAERQQGKG